LELGAEKGSEVGEVTVDGALGLIGSRFWRRRS